MFNTENMDVHIVLVQSSLFKALICGWNLDLVHVDTLNKIQFKMKTPKVVSIYELRASVPSVVIKDMVSTVNDVERVIQAMCQGGCVMQLEMSSSGHLLHFRKAQILSSMSCL